MNEWTDHQQIIRVHIAGDRPRLLGHTIADSQRSNAGSVRPLPGVHFWKTVNGKIDAEHRSLGWLALLVLLGNPNVENQ
jgi:hypothetical protein